MLRIGTRAIGLNKGFAFRGLSSLGQIDYTPRAGKVIIPDQPDQVQRVLSLSTACSKDILKHKISLAVEKFRSHPVDTGSTSVQIAVLTEKITNLARHFAVNKKDHHGHRGFQAMVYRRKGLLKYLKRKDFEQFKKTVIALGLQRDALNL